MLSPGKCVWRKKTIMWRIEEKNYFHLNKNIPSTCYPVFLVIPTSVPYTTAKTCTENKLASLEATLVQNYDRFTHSLTGVKCRATSVAKNHTWGASGTVPHSILSLVCVFVSNFWAGQSWNYFRPLINLRSNFIWTKVCAAASLNAFLSHKGRRHYSELEEGQWWNINGGSATQTRIMIDSHCSNLPCTM